MQFTGLIFMKKELKKFNKMFFGVNNIQMNKKMKLRNFKQ